MALLLFDKNGKQISMDEYIELHQDAAYARVGYDVFTEAVVSTVWLGVHPGAVYDPPAIFETAVFYHDETRDGEIFRYATLEDAQVGHSLTCQALGAGLDPALEPCVIQEYPV